MLARAAVIGLRVICVVLALSLVLAITAVYVPVLRANADRIDLAALVPLLVAFFGVLMPASFVFPKGRRRETTMMVASFGWVVAMGAWFVTLYGWSLATPVREAFREGISGPLMNFSAMVLFAANGLVSLRSLRRDRQPSGQMPATER